MAFVKLESKNPSTPKEELILVENSFCGTKSVITKCLRWSSIIANLNSEVSEKDKLYSPKYNTLLRHGSVHKRSYIYVVANVESGLELSWLKFEARVESLNSSLKLGANVESSEKLIIRVEFLLVSKATC